MTEDEFDRNEFSVWLFFRNGGSRHEARWLDGHEACVLAVDCMTRPAALAGWIRRVIITDGGDCCCFEWKHGEGIIWPREETVQ